MTKYEKMRCFKCGSVNILFSYATGYECKDCGAKSGDPEGFVYDCIFPVKEDQQATIAQLTAERDAWKINANTMASDNVELAKIAKKRTAERDEWRKDAERLIQLANFKNKRASEYFDLHQQLVEKYGGEK